MRRTGIALLLAACSLIVGARAAFAVSFTRPTSPMVVQLDAHDHPKAMTVAVRGFNPGALVYVEQCDGVSPATPQWSPSINCDLGNSPAAAVVDRNGVASFDASDVPHAFVPFAGESPQSIFNCIAKGDRAPSDGLPTFSTCQVRVATNPSNATTDQIFATLTLPRGAISPPPAAATSTTVKKPAKSKVGSGVTSSTTAKRASKSTDSAKSVSDASVSIALHPNSATSGSGSDTVLGMSKPAFAGLALLVVGLVIAAGSVWFSRRRRGASVS